MVSEIQCPGCTCGVAPASDCENFKQDTEYGFYCKAHSAGTLLGGAGWIALGLPKGFDRVGAHRAKGEDSRSTNIRLWIAPDHPQWNTFNMAAWAMVRDGYLYVRTYLPRTNRTFVDVVKNGTFDMVPEGVVNVGDIYDAID